MTKIEIIAHEALEEALIQALVPVPPGQEQNMGKAGHPFTLMKGLAGRGASGSAFGDDVWPESNLSLILFRDESELEEIRKNVDNLRKDFPNLGLAVFIQRGYDEWERWSGGDD
ncbi:MAG: hypothetical protein MI717_04795 [Spirochaetales bacterium]|nr:hypothetical protein [Spirochaetales bacterium]